MSLVVTTLSTSGTDMIVVDMGITTKVFHNVTELLQYFHDNRKTFSYCGDEYKPKNVPYTSNENLTLVDGETGVKYEFDEYCYVEVV